MRKFWIMAATVALLGFGAAVVSAQVGGSSSSDDSTTATETTTTSTTTTDPPAKKRDGDHRRKAREDEGRGFGQGLISEKSLDEVILAYLSEDAEEK